MSALNFVDEVNGIEARIDALRVAIETKRMPVARGQYAAVAGTIDRLKNLQGAIVSNTKLTAAERWQMQADYFS